ncbi:MAG: hypothetical protein E6G51_03995 [Actinobacteria bacterium]|nr:MAG: hypothetical protein E6G51_03995 [Actinomycetota bacterium]
MEQPDLREFPHRSFYGVLRGEVSGIGTDFADEIDHPEDRRLPVEDVPENRFLAEIVVLKGR